MNPPASNGTQFHDRGPRVLAARPVGAPVGCSRPVSGGILLVRSDRPW